MANGMRQPIAMANPQGWLAFVRIVVGLYFVKSIVTKMTVGLVGGFLPLPVVTARWLDVMPKIVGRQAAENPIAWYKDFLQNTVIPNSDVFAALTAWGETIAGLGLTLGLFTGIAALVGLFLVANYGLATQHMSPGQQGFHIVLFVLMLAFFFARAGRAYGLDAVLARRNPRSWVARRPVS